MKKIGETIKNAIYGFCMALADSVPGVSGGTVAFILGFYDKFVNSLNAVITKGENKKTAIIFLIKLGIGWIIGMAVASLALSSLFEKHIYEVSSTFIGFILLAIPLIIKNELKSFKGKYQNILFTIIGMAIVIAITFFKSNNIVLDIGNLNIGLSIYIFLAGMIAVSAMILPGISGSTILLVFGLYIPILNGIKEFLHMNFEYVSALFIFGFGVIAGVLLVIKLVKKALEKYRSQTMYTILGLMLGSFYPIIMGATTLKEPKAAMSFDTFNIICFIIGGLIIIGMEIVQKKLINKE